MVRTKDLKRIILETLAEESKLHGYTIHRKLLSSNIHVQRSRLYGVLHEMLSDGLIKDRWERSRSGPKKRVYELTRLGREKLNSPLSEEKSIKIDHQK